MADHRIQVAFRDGAFVPLGEVDYAEGSTLSITVHGPEVEDTESRREQVLRDARGSWKGLVDPDEAIARLRAGRLVDTRPEPKM